MWRPSSETERPTRDACGPYQRTHQPEKEGPLEPPEEALGGVSWYYWTTSYSVWGRVVPDIPDFCRELVAALAEG